MMLIIRPLIAATVLTLTIHTGCGAPEDEPAGESATHSALTRSRWVTYVGGSDDLVMKRRDQYICYLSEVHGYFGDSPNDVLSLPTIRAVDDRWVLAGVGPRFGFTCYSHEAFSTPPGGFISWTEQHGNTWVSTGFPSCSASNVGQSWAGDSITFLSGISGEFEGFASQIWVFQSQNGADPSGVIVDLDNCFSQMSADYGTYFVGVPGWTLPVFMGPNDVRVLASSSDSEFVATANKNQSVDVIMAPIDQAMCYMTAIGGDFNGDGERGAITMSGGRWILHANAGGGSVSIRARCLATDQGGPGQLPPPQ